MFKRIIAVALAALLLVSMAVIAVSAADGNESAGADANNSAGADTNSEASGASNVVKFDPSGIWSNISTVYCHIWPIGKDSFYGWQANAEKCEKVGATYQYDLDKLNDVSKSTLLRIDAAELAAWLRSWSDEFAPEYAFVFSDSSFTVESIK